MLIWFLLLGTNIIMQLNHNSIPAVHPVCRLEDQNQNVALTSNYCIRLWPKLRRSILLFFAVWVSGYFASVFWFCHAASAVSKNSQFQYFFLVESSIHSQTSRRPKSSMATDFAEICSPFVAIGHHIDVNFRKVFGSNLFIYTRAEKICLRFAMQLYISDLFSSNNFFFFRLLDLHPSLIVCHLPQH